MAELKEKECNNGITDCSLIVRRKGSGVAPAFQLSGFYQGYITGVGIQEVMEDMAQCYCKESMKDMDVTSEAIYGLLHDADRLRGRVCFRLVNAEMNAGFLSRSPHRIIGGLAVTYYIFIDLAEGFGSVQLTEEHVRTLLGGMAEEELFALARENTPKFLPMEIVDMKLFSAVTNREMAYGAAALLYPGMMEYLTGRFGEFVILPSSVHEVLILPAAGEPDIPALMDIVRGVNGNEQMVGKSELLSWNVFRKSGEFFEPAAVAGEEGAGARAGE